MQVDPAHNLDALLIGTAEFSFSDGALTKAQAVSKGFLDFGNVVAITPERDTERVDHYGSYRGVRRLDKSVNTRDGLRFKIRVDEFNQKNVEIMFGGLETDAFTQGAQAAAAGQDFEFSAEAAVIGKWYDVFDSSGNRIKHLTGLTIAGLTDGTDFVTDLLLGRVKFLTAQSTDLTPTLTAPAIALGDDFSGFAIIPLQNPVKTGFGHITFYDQNDQNKVVMGYEYFSCEVSLDTANELDGQNFTEMTLDVLVTGEVGVQFWRFANRNAGLIPIGS